MPVNPYSRHLGLLKVLHTTLNTAEEKAAEAISNIISYSILTGVSLFIAGFFVNILWIALSSYLIGAAYTVRRILLKEFNIKQFRESIEGETFSVEEVNEDMVLLWLSKCNIVIGRSDLILRIWPIMTRLYMYTTLFMACCILWYRV